MKFYDHVCSVHTWIKIGHTFAADLGYFGTQYTGIRATCDGNRFMASYQPVRSRNCGLDMVFYVSLSHNV